MGGVIRFEVSHEEAERRLVEGQLKRLVRHPARHDFVFADGTVMSLYDASNDYSCYWVVDSRPRGG